MKTSSKTTAKSQANTNEIPTSFKWVILAILIVWGSISFLFLCGDDNPDSPMSTGRFLLVKAIAMASLCLAWKVGSKAEDLGFLPDSWTHIADKFEEED